MFLRAHNTYYIIEVVMSISGFFTFLLFAIVLTGWYVWKEESFENRDPMLLLIIPFFMILFMVVYAMTMSVGTNVRRIFLPIQ
jgi:hypothetical protein